MKCPICVKEVSSDQSQQWGPECAHVDCVNAFNAGRSVSNTELTEANDYIQRLEDELIEAKGQWAALVADVVLYEDRAERIKRLEEAGGEMQKWLLSYDEHYVYALNVINNWNKAKK